jgi:hypothetical protein
MEDDERSGRSRFHRTNENVEKMRNLLNLDSQPSLLCRNTEAVI